MTPSLALWKYELEWERRVEEAAAHARALAAAAAPDDQQFVASLEKKLGSLPPSQPTEKTRVLGRVAHFAPPP